MSIDCNLEYRQTKLLLRKLHVNCYYICSCTIIHSVVMLSIGGNNKETERGMYVAKQEKQCFSKDSNVCIILYEVCDA